MEEYVRRVVTLTHGAAIDFAGLIAVWSEGAVAEGIATRVRVVRYTEARAIARAHVVPRHSHSFAVAVHVCGASRRAPIET